MNNGSVLQYDRERVLYDVGSLAFVAADVKADGRPAHALHQALDILEAGNIDRVNGILDLASAEVGVLLQRGSPIMIRGHKYGGLSVAEHLLQKELIHQYLVARVLADWLSITLPEAAGVWKEKAAEVFNALSAVLRGGGVLTRRVPPI